MTALPPPAGEQPTRYRYGVLAFCCALAMLNYLDRVCFSGVTKFLQAEFVLTNTQIGYLFSAFALAYAICEVPTGWLGDRFGPRVTLIRVVLWWSVFTALTGLVFPSMLGIGSSAFAALLAIRFLFGAGEAGAFPNVSRAFANWFPLSERGFAQGTVWMAGRFAGGITPLIVLFLLIPIGKDPGGKTIYYWRHIFWIFGLLGVVWCIAFWYWFRDRPDQKAGVNAAEREHIHAGLVPEVGHSAVPWRRILGSANLWLLCLMYFCAAYGWYFNITWLPKLLDEQYGVNADNPTWGFWWTSLLIGMPLLLGSLACLLGGLLTDWFIRRTGNRRWGRRLFGMIGHGVCALCYLASVYAASPVLFVLAVALAAFWNDLTMGAAWASCIDIGKRYAGIISGMMNMIGNLGGFMAGFITGMVLDAYALPVKHEQALATSQMLAAADPLTTAATALVTAEATERYLAASRYAWNLNLLSYAFVYFVAMLLWAWFDASKPIIPEDEEPPTKQPG